MPVQTQLQQRRGTAASWTSTNPTLAAGEIGFESDTGKIKIGNGSTAWNALAYTASSTAVTYLFNATGGQTTFSGADANGLTLAYTVGAEQVYLNGVLQVRGSDYTATNGTSIVLVSGALVSDVLNVIAFSALSLSDTYTQAQADAKFFQTASTVVAGKNAVINGGMDIWQRGTSIACTTTTTYTADRFYGFRGGVVAGQTVSRQATNDTTNLPFIQYCARVQRDSGNTSTQGLNLLQDFESVNSIPYAGRTITFSFYARAGANYSPAGNNLTAILLSGTGTDQTIRGGYTGSATVLSVGATLTTTWQRFQGTATVSSSATQLGFYFTNTPVGTAGANDWFEVTGVQLETGSIATPFARNSGTIQGELAACQRYCQSYGESGTVFFGNGYTANTNEAYNLVQIPKMRTTPTATFSGTFIIIDVAGDQDNATGNSLWDASSTNVRIRSTSSGAFTGGRFCQLLSTTGATFILSAEL